MMDRKILPKAVVPEWVDHLRQDYRVIAPLAVQEYYVFSELDSQAEVVLDYPSSILPPKKAFLPVREELLQFNHAQHSIEPVLDRSPTVILAVHTCDLHAIQSLDRFYQTGFCDQHYDARRENTILVSVECLAPCSEHSFCKDMNTDSLPEEFDLHLTDLGEVYAVDFGSSRGESLLQNFTPIREITPEERRRFDRAVSQKWSRFTYRMKPTVSELPSLFTLNYKSVLWEEIGERCLSCGVCTLVCPTCSCFDVRDEVDITFNAGRRYRIWDSCQVNSFASVAGGHDFRPTPADRLRHRFFHKFKYQPGSSSPSGCVGCGRCAEACLVQINPVDVVNKLYLRRSMPTGVERRG